MGKLKKVLLLVLALCMMISIMSIAATATDEETYWVVKYNNTTGVLYAEATNEQPDGTYYNSEAEAVAAYQAGAQATITYGGTTTYYANPYPALLQLNTNNASTYSGSTCAEDVVVKLFADCNWETYDENLYFMVPMTLDLNGHTVAFGKNGYTYRIQKDFVLKDTSAGQTGLLYGAHATIAAVLLGTSSQGCTFTLESGTIQSETAIFDTYNNVTINIEGGKMVSFSKYGTGDSRGIVAELCSGCALNITGGEFRSDQSAKSFDTMSFDPMGYPTKNINANSTISVTGGTFSGQAIQKYVPGYTADQSFSNTKTEITVGDYTITRSTVSSPYGAAPYDVYLYTVTPAVTYVAQINETKYASLAEAIAAVPTDGTATTITMIADYEVPMDHADSSSGGYNVVNVAKDQNVILDLNGKTITGVIAYDAKNSAVITVSEYGTLTIRDTSAAQTGTITHVKYDDGVRVGNWAAQNWQTDILFNHGGTLTVEGGTIANTANGNICYAIDTSNNYRHNNATLTITGGTITSQYCEAIRMRLDNPVYGENSSRNVINISGGTISGRGGIWAQVSSGTAPKGSLTITGGTITGGEWGTLTYSAGSGVSIDDFPASITGGKITGTVELPQVNYISGGKFSNELEATRIAEGYEAVANTDDDAATYPFVVTEAIPAVAQIGNVKYATLAEALAAAQAGDTIKLLKNIETSNVVLIGKSITLDGNGHSLITSANRGIRVNSGNVDVTIKDLTIPADSNLERAIQVDSDMDNVKLTIDNVTATATYYTVNICDGVDNLNLTINQSILSGWSAINLWGCKGEVEITNSTLTGTNKFSTASNSFGTLVIEGDTTGQTDMAADTITIRVINTTINAFATGAQKQYAFLFNNPSAKNVVVVDGGSVILGENNCELVRIGGTENTLTMALTNDQKTAVEAAGYTATVNAEDSGKYDIRFNPEVYYYWAVEGGYEGVDCKLEDVFDQSKSFIGDGEFVLFKNNVILTKNSICAMYGDNATGTLNMTLGDYIVTAGDYTVTLAVGTNVKTDKQVAFFSAPNGYRVVETANGDGTYTYGVAAITYVAQIGDVKYETLQAAIDAAQSGNTITLLANVTQDEGILFNKADVSVKLDLNGKTLTVNNGSNINYRAIKINNGTLEVYNGSIVAVGSGTTSSNGTGCYGAFRVEANGKLIAHDLTLTNSRPWGLNVKVLGGEAELTNVTINSSYGGGIEVTEADLGTHSKAGKATLTNCTFTQSGYFDHCSTALSVSGGSELIVNSGSYTGEYALYVFSSGGKIKVNGGTFTGLGNNNRRAIVAEIDTTTYPQYEGGLEISGGSFSGSYNITSPAYMTITGGYFTVDPTAYVADGYAVENGAYEIGDVTYNHKVGVAPVAQIGTTKYTSLEAAIDAAQSGDTIKLLADVTYGTDHVVDVWEKKFNLDLNSHTFTTNSEVGITLANNGYKAAALCWSLGSDGSKPITVTNGTIITAYGAGIYVDDPAIVATLSGLTINANTVGVQTTDEYSSVIRLTCKANAIIESGTYSGHNVIAVSSSGGHVTVNGGTFTGDIFFGSGFNSGLTAADKTITINGGLFTGNFVNTDKGTLVIKGGYFTVDPTAYVAEGYSVVEGDFEGYTYKVVPYVEQSTTNTTTTTTTTDEQLGTTTTTTTTTDLATNTEGATTQYVIKVETTTVTTHTDDPENPTEQTNTTYKPVTVGVTSGNDVATNVVVTNTSGATDVTAAKATVQAAVTGQAATFEAKLDGNSGTSSANVLKTTAAANAIAKAAAKVGAAGKTGDITDAKVILQTTLKSYTLAGTSNAVVATKVLYDIKPVAVLYNVEGTQLGNAVELDNADIKEGESFTFTIPVPANMTATTVKVSHIGTNGYSSEIGTYHVDGTGNNRYVTVIVDHFSDFELEEAEAPITGSCKITASLSLNDSININFYVRELASGTSRDNYKVVYSFNGETEITVDGASWVETVTGSGKYFFKVAECAASQMNDKVIFKVYYGEVEIASVSYSIRDYCKSKIDANSNQKLVELCRAVLDYGAAAQKYFNYNTENLANAGGYGLASPVTEIPSEFNALAVDRRSDISKLTASLNTVSKTEINFYITASDVTDVTVKLGETPVEDVVTEHLSDGRYRVTIKGIAAAHLNNVYTLTFKTAVGTSTLRYSALTYSYGKQSSQTAGELSLAIYNYYLKAAAYFS